MIPIHIDAAWRGTANCRACAIRQSALFADLEEADFALIHAPIDALEFPAGAVIYREGEAAGGLFTLRLGSVKLVRYTRDGRAPIVRVLREGDVAGLEALATEQYDTEAVALTRVELCRIPLSVVRALDRQSPRLHHKLTHRWRQALRHAEDWLAELASGPARRRVAHLVLHLRHAADPELVTLYSREDMGAMLDLKLETVSREVSQLVRDGLIESLDRQGRTYRILDEVGLRAG